ncbi:3 beta-hydroxysteroid dehydrogenase type 7-like [Hyperolius riggenbachi]|uniref:3 beta-hydroxysteroid dehydrogenase type 7-like n=1 Tax=Hyperolius riggenbachi TaxID=752182 RepID=UPI0035A2F4C0
MAKNVVYLITGGCGFIGEHIVKFLLREEYVKDVRIFDLNESEVIRSLELNSCLYLGTADYDKITFIKGDITDYRQILEALKGVHVVIHTAALVDYLDEYPFKKLEAVNVKGTENIVNACLDAGVPYLLYTSSITAAGPNTNLDPMVGIKEDTVYHGEQLLNYGKTKARAEKLVLLANGQQLNNGNKFVTCAIRPCTVYGEKTETLLTMYRTAKSHNNRIDYTGVIDSEHNITYVGNVAWMHVLAARHMQLKPALLGGQVFYAYDETPFTNWIKLYHEVYRGIDPSIQIGAQIPYWKLWLIVSVFNLIRFFLKPFWNLKPFLTLPILKLLTVTYYHDSDKAFRHFNYKPFYSWGESKRRTCLWLKQETETLKKQ